jgi:septal ring factor EnvC (AmiA/AmiB activator)
MKRDNLYTEFEAEMEIINSMLKNVADEALSPTEVTAVTALQRQRAQLQSSKTKLENQLKEVDEQLAKMDAQISRMQAT